MSEKRVELAEAERLEIAYASWRGGEVTLKEAAVTWDVSARVILQRLRRDRPLEYRVIRLIARTLVTLSRVKERVVNGSST